MKPLMHVIPNTSGRGLLSQRAHATEMSLSSRPGDNESSLESKREGLIVSKHSLSGPTES